MDETKLNEFVQRARQAAGENLESVVLFGSAASGEYDPEFSDLNLFCVLRAASGEALAKLSPVAEWWAKQKQPPPLVMTRAELERANDTFTIELLDMKQHHRVLFGDDVVQALDIPLDLHRVQVEYELREKQVLLRQQYLLAAGRDKRVWELLLGSAPSIATLFRHALIALGQPAPTGRREAVQALSAHVGFDLSVVPLLLDIRRKRDSARQHHAQELFARYAEAVGQVTDAVDKMGPVSLKPR